MGTTSEAHQLSEVRHDDGKDGHDMSRLARKQHFKRRWSFLPLASLLCLVMASWQTVYASSPFALINGGRAGLVWGFLITWVMNMFVVVSIAEVASMAPTSGGQYHWVSEFAPASIQRGLSYSTGWLNALGNQAFVASVCYGTAVLMITCISIGVDSYEPQPWQTSLATIAIAVAAIFFNIFLAEHLPRFDGIIMYLNVLMFFVQHLALWIVAPKVSAAEVFTKFENRGGWPSTSAATLIGLITAASALVGIDAAAHMAEEVENASKVVPKVMVTVGGFNGLLGFVAAVTMAFSVRDIDAQILSSTAAFPWIDVARQTMGRDLTLIVLCPQVLVTFAMVVTVIAAASRQARSFAEDGGLVFPKHLQKVRCVRGTAQPINATLLSLPVCVVAAGLNLAGSEVFNSIIGLLLGAVNLTLTITIDCVLWRRTCGPKQAAYGGSRLPPATFSLGERMGRVCNVIAVLFLTAITTISFFPVFAQTTAKSMNWGIAMFGGAIVISVVGFFVWGRRNYKAPVENMAQEVTTSLALNELH